MAATPYKPVSWSDRSLDVSKLQQMATNDQWLFENSPRMRYSGNGVVRDNGIKIIAGKTPYATSSNDWVDVSIYFGSFFTAACKPIVICTDETTGAALRKLVVTRGFGGEIDYRGFVAHISDQENHIDRAHYPIESPGWVHWIAVGF